MMYNYNLLLKNKQGLNCWLQKQHYSNKHSCAGFVSQAVGRLLCYMLRVCLPGAKLVVQKEIKKIQREDRLGPKSYQKKPY